MESDPYPPQGTVDQTISQGMSPFLDVSHLGLNVASSRKPSMIQPHPQVKLGGPNITEGSEKLDPDDL